MKEALEARLLWESELRRGIAEGQLRLFYQVQIGLGQCVRGGGAGALAAPRASGWCRRASLLPWPKTPA